MRQVVVAEGTEDSHAFDLTIALALAVGLLLASCAGALLRGGAFGAALGLLYFFAHLYIMYIHHHGCALDE